MGICSFFPKRPFFWPVQWPRARVRRVAISRHIRRQKRRGVIMHPQIVILAALVAAVPALAGHWGVEWQPVGGLSLALREGPLGLRLEGVVSPATGPERPGRGELRLAGVVVHKWEGPPYTFSLPVDPEGEGEGIPAAEGRRGRPVRIRPGLKYGLEAVIWAGKKWLSTTAEFAVVEAPPAEAKPAPAEAQPAQAGLQVSEEELKKLAEEAYRAGYEAGKASTPAQPEPPKPAMARVVVRLREAGNPVFGVVRLLHTAGFRRLEGIGQLEAEVPPGPVSLQIRREAGWRWLLPPGQSACVEAREGQTIIWDLFKVPEEVKK